MVHHIRATGLGQHGRGLWLTFLALFTIIIQIPSLWSNFVKFTIVPLSECWRLGSGWRDVAQSTPFSDQVIGRVIFLWTLVSVGRWNCRSLFNENWCSYRSTCIWILLICISVIFIMFKWYKQKLCLNYKDAFNLLLCKVCHQLE